MFVTKFDGRNEKFSREKIVSACLNVGLDRQKADEISRRIEGRVKGGLYSEDIYRMITEEAGGKHSKLLRLREAISRLDPRSFEIYVKRILENNGYTCTWNRIFDGKCIDHQVDVVAEKGGKKYIVECKHHRNPHRYLGLGVALQVQARLEDILDKGDNYMAWLVTNTKFSEHAKTYAGKKDILMTGWRYKSEFALDSLVHGSKMYPVTLLDASTETRRKLLANSAVTVSDVEERKDIMNIVGERDYANLASQISELK